MGGQAGIALVGGLMNGFAQGRKQAEEMSLQKEYKNIMTKKMKTELDLQEQIFNIDKQLLDPNIDDATAYPLVNARARLSGKDPIEAVMGYKQMKRLMGQGGQPQQQVAPNIGMNYEEPTASQVTFPAQLTGAPQMPNLGDDQFEEDFMRKKYGMGVSREAAGRIPGRDAQGNPAWLVYGKNGTVVSTFPRDEEVDYQQTIDENGNPIKIPMTKTGNIVPGKPALRQPVEVVREPVTSADGSITQQPVPKFQSPQTAMKGTPPIATFETPQAGWQGLVSQIKKDQGRNLTVGAFLNKYAPPNENNTNAYVSFVSEELGVNPNTPLKKVSPHALAGVITSYENVNPAKNNPGGLREAGQLGLVPKGIQTKPAGRATYLKNDDLKKYINAETGERPKGNWTEEMLDSSKYVKEPDPKPTLETVSRLSNAIQSMPAIDILEGRMFKDGKLDEGFAAKLSLWYAHPKIMAGSEVAEYGRKYMGAISAQVRLETSATKTEGEQKDAIQEYANEVFSSPGSVSAGIGQLKGKLAGTINMYDPTGFYQIQHGRGKKQPSLDMKGKSNVLDDATILKFLSANGNDPKKAKEAAKKAGYKVD